MPNLYIHALGCKTNHYENQAIAQKLQEHGFELTDNIKDADVGLLNTCTVTAEAGRKSRQFLRKMKKQNPKILVVAMGCYAQLEDVSEIADLVIGTDHRNSVLNLIQERINQKENREDIKDFTIELEEDLAPIGKASQETQYEELGIIQKQSDTRAQIKIQDGCNAFCTYCAIPLARGRVRSRLRENIMNEAKALIKNGHKEIVLTGIHICSFEKELGRNSEALAELCIELNTLDGLERIRLGSLEPLSVNKEFLNILKNADKVCPHFHLSLQSGSDSVLKRMKRNYNTAQYRQVVEQIREIYDQPAITTDIMVGFPEETDEEFEESLEFVEDIQLSQLHVFPYSVRPGTKAAKMRQISSNTVKNRADLMLDKGKVLHAAYARKFIGKEQRVILEDVVGNYLRGFSDQYLRIYLPKTAGKSGEIKKVIVKREEDANLFVD